MFGREDIQQMPLTDYQTRETFGGFLAAPIAGCQG